MRDFIDSLYHGYPVGYLITWSKPGISLRGGESSNRERVLIDEQQRTMALRAALLGREVLTKKYQTRQIQIAFHPGTERFAEATKVIRGNPEWIPDISTVFNSNSGLLRLVDEYCGKNEGVDRYEMGERIGRLYIPHVDIAIYNPTNSHVVAVIRCEVNLRRYMLGIVHWRFKLRTEENTASIKFYLVTTSSLSILKV